MPTNTHVFETRMSNRMQASFIKKPVFRLFVNTEEREKLKKGKSVTRPFTSLIRGQDYTRNGTLQFQNVEEENETLTVDTVKATPFQIDEFDEEQSNFPLQRLWAEKATDELKALIDADMLAEVVNAASVIDAADFGGASGDPMDLDVSNVFSIFTMANWRLQEKEVDVTGMDPRMEMKETKTPGYGGVSGFGVYSPYFHSVLNEAEQNRETEGGDRAGVNGYVKTRSGYDLALSNNNFWSAVLNLATNPTNGDTLTIKVGSQTITVTFVSSIGVTAGNVLIAGNVDLTRANLEALINTPGTTTANGVAFSATRPNKYTRSPREVIEDLTAVNDNTGNTLTLTGAGMSYMVLGETLTDATDGWAKETQHNIMGRKGCVDHVMQVGPNVKVSETEDGFSAKIKPRALYGKKTFVEGALSMIDLKINTANLR